MTSDLSSRSRDLDDFIGRLSSLYEYSPWISEQVFESGDAVYLGLEELHDSFRSVVLSAGLEQQLDLLNAHPDLACAREEQSMLTAESQDEQIGAGLDQCTEEEFDEFGELNRIYRETFGFPFILAVKGYTRQEILEVFRDRLGNDPGSEFAEALRQVCRIGRFRLEALFDER